MGWEPVWFSEINPFCNKVLKYHYPEVPNLGDMCRLDEQSYYHEQPIDVLEGGTPCQGFSLAGLRGGLADKRSNLALEFCRILITKQPRWFVWENVPGVLSAFSNEAEGEHEVWQTSDFATLLEAFRQCGYSCSYRVFDSQHFGVPQRRRRVFVVGYLGNDWSEDPEGHGYDSAREYTPQIHAGTATADAPKGLASQLRAALQQYNKEFYRQHGPQHDASQEDDAPSPVAVAKSASSLLCLIRPVRGLLP